MIKLDIRKAACFLAEGAVEGMEKQTKAAHKALEDGTSKGSDFLGWLHLPSSLTPEFLRRPIRCAANVIQSSWPALAALISVHAP